MMEVRKFIAQKSQKILSVMEESEKTLLPKPLMSYKIPQFRFFLHFTTMPWFWFLTVTETLLKAIFEECLPFAGWFHLRLPIFLMIHVSRIFL